MFYGIISRFIVLSETKMARDIVYDAEEYFKYAKNLSIYNTYGLSYSPEGNVLKDSKRPPGFPFFASFFYNGDDTGSVKPVLFFQTVIQIIMLTFFTLMCLKYFGKMLTLFISLLIWTHPVFMSLNTYYLSESLFLSSLIVIVMIFMLSITGKNRGQCYIFGILLGAAVAVSSYIRSTMDYYIFFIAIILLLTNIKLFKRFLPAIATFILMVFAWKIRNYFAFGSFSDNHLMINGLFHGSYPNFMYNNMHESLGFAYKFDPHEKEYYKGVGTTLSIIWYRVKESPLDYISWYLLGKQFFLWQWSEIAGWDIYIYKTVTTPFLYAKDLIFFHSVHKLLNPLIMTTGVLYSYFIIIKGIIKRSELDLKFIISSLIVYASVFHIITAPYPRYGYPFKPFVIVMSVLAFAEVVKYILKKRKKEKK